MLENNPGFNHYYDMWVKRMLDGHNLSSRAIHYGYSPNPACPLSSEEAKIATDALIARELDLQDKHLVLGDLGCGVGGTAFYMANEFPDSHIFAVNIHMPQLNLLKTFPDFPPGKILMVNADFINLPFKSNSLDGAYAIDSSCYAPDKPAFYQEAMRTIKPGSRLVVFDVFYNRPPEDTEEKAMLRNSLLGWLVPNWHPIPHKDLFAEYSYTDITKNTMADIDRSFQTASNKIDSVEDPVMKGHLNAIIALHKCLQLNLVQYGLLVISKPNFLRLED